MLYFYLTTSTKMQVFMVIDGCFNREVVLKTLPRVMIETVKEMVIQLCDRVKIKQSETSSPSPACGLPIL